MKSALFLLLASASPAMAQVHDHSGHDHVPAANLPEAPPPASAKDHAADTIYGSAQMEQSRKALVTENGGMTTFDVQFNMLEARIGKGRNGYYWDAAASYGGDLDRIELKSEGESTFGAPASVETQLVWSHAISPQFNLQAGARHDAAEGADRGYALVGVSGTAPYNIGVEAIAFLSDKGDVTGRLKADHDMLVTQGLIVQPLVELQLAARNIPHLGMGKGISSMRAGMRMRYEIAPEFAPYIGIEWLKDLGRTARYTRAAGDDPDQTFIVAGLRFWF